MPDPETPSAGEPEILSPERNGPSAERGSKEPPVIDAVAEDEDEPARPAAPSAVASSGGSRIVGFSLAAGIIGAMVLVVALNQAGLVGTNDTDPKVIGDLSSRLDANASVDETQTQSLKAIESQLAVSGKALEEAAAMPARLDAAEAAVAAAKAAADAQTERLATIEKNLPPADIAAQITQLSAMVKALNTAVDSLAPKIAELDKRVAALEAKKDDPDAAARAALGLALSNLSRATSGSEPFARELDVVAAFLPNEPELGALKTVAEKGVPTAATLETEFPLVVQRVLDAERAASGDGWWARFVSNFKKLVTLRRTGEIAGDDTDAVLARMEERVGRGDLSAAISEAAGLKGPAAAAAKPWVADATARVTTSDLLAALSANITKRLAAGIEG
ncbi:MAG: mitofilin family membrane protein [Pseudomonadota bacterium]